MIEFYHKFFKKTYKQEVSKLILDLEKLLAIESIELNPHYSFVLNDEFNHKLPIETWHRINQIYDTLERQKDRLSTILLKFVNKTNTPHKLTFVDTFAGCGGLSLGLEQAGFKVKFVNEIEAKFLQTYYFNHTLPLNHYHCGDIKDIVKNYRKYEKEFTNTDVFVGGPPCQGFSMANRQRILDDPRNELYRYFLELLKSIQPKFFVMENVKGMLNKAEEIKQNFKDTLGESYSTGIVLLNAKDFGIPQNRERVFVIGSRVKNVTASEIIHDINQQKAKARTLSNALDGLPELGPKSQKNNPGLENESIGFRIKHHEFKQTPFEQYINSEASSYLFNHCNRFNNARDLEIFEKLPTGANSLHESIKDIMPYNSRNHIFKDKYFKLDPNKVCKTITSHMKFDCNMYIHPSQPRGLSPREAARVQTFPDHYRFLGSHNQWYAQIGNAVPVKLAEIIGQSLIKHLL